MSARDLCFEIVFRATPDRVWRELTDPAAIPEWWEGVTEVHLDRLGAGGRYRFRFANGTEDTGDVLEVEVGRRLVYRWTSSEPGPTVVEYALEPEEGCRATRVHFANRGFGEGPCWDRAHDEDFRGWLGMFLGIRRRLEGTDLRAIGQEWMRAFNARDLDALLALYAEDAVHTSPKLRERQPETGGLIRGRTALREWWADSFRRLPGLRYDSMALTADAERVWFEYRRVLSGQPDSIVAEVLIVREGRIVESRVYHG